MRKIPVLRSLRCLFRDALLVMAMAPLVVLPPHVMANPSGEHVVAGDVTFAGGPGTLDITQLGAAGIVNWQDFGIGASEIVNIMQDSANAALLNRVLGANPSEILGQLNATGRVYLINPNGLVIGKDARIDVGSFIATTAQISDADFLAGGPLTFAQGSGADIVNLGVIKAQSGDAVLVAHRVVNAGEIRAPSGEAALGAATEFVYAPLGDNRLRIVVTDDRETAGGTGVDNRGLLDAAEVRMQAADGNLYELAINQSGHVRATGIERRGGRVLLTATGGTVEVAGTITARNGDGSGGEVLVGGDYQGANAEVPNVDFVRFGADAVIDVAAGAADADGGRAIVWADGQTDFAGKIEGQGGALGGDGAFAEVSGKRILNYHGLADLTAPFGETGTLLLDPNDVLINTDTDDQANGVFNNTVLSTNLGTANVVIDASNYGGTSGDGEGLTVHYGDINVRAPISWTSGNRLTLKAGNSIDVRADINAPGAALDFQVMSADSSGFASVSSRADAAITADSITIGQNADATFVGLQNEPADTNDLGIGPPTPPAVADRAIGYINLSGVVDVGTLDIKTENAGIDPKGFTANQFTEAIRIANAANKIGTLTSSTTSGSIDGAINIVDSDGDLTVGGNFSNITSGYKTTITTAGTLTLATGAKLGSGTGADVVLAAKSGAFTNNAGASAVAPGTGGRFLIYSDDPANSTKGGLTGTPVYNKTFAANAPSSITQTGNRFIYSLAPTLTVSATSQTREYGADNAALAFTVSGLVGGDTAAQAFTGTPSLSTTITSANNAGSYADAITITANTVVASDYGYQLAFAAGDFTISKAVLTATGTNATRFYGDANPAFTGSVTGFKFSQDASVLITAPTFGTAATITSDVGTHAINGTGGSATNYSFNFVPGTLTIDPVALTLTANAASRDYGDADPTFTASYSGFKNGDTASVVSGLTYGTNASAASDVGAYTITPSNGTATNYTITHAPGTLTVDPAAVTVTAADASRSYGASNPTFTGNATGLKLGQDASVLTNLGYSSTAVSASDAGSYAITPGGATNTNYTYTYTPGSLTVNPAALTIAANNAAAVFNTAIPTFTAGYTGLVNGDTAADITGLTLTTTATQGDSVGSYAITAANATNANYAISFTSGILTISNQILTITANDLTRTYGGANPTFTATTTGFVGADDISILTSPISFTTTAVTTSNAGTYAITPSGATAPNYDITFVPGTLTIDPALLTLTATNFTRTYGDANPTFTASYSGFVAGDTASDITGLVFNTPATAASNAGTYAITPSGASNTNYTITQNAGSLTVDRAALAITLADQTRTYGDANPAFSTSITGFKLSDDASVLTGLAPSTTATASSHVGGYAITTGAVTATNYTVSVTAGNLKIDPAELTVTADDLAKSFGATNPTLTTTNSGYKLSDDASVLTGLTLTTTATTHSNVGSYAITPAGATATNYNISFVPGALTVNPAALTITADSMARTYGSDNPALTATLAGLTAGNTEADIPGLTFATTATRASNIGAYAITPSGATNSNYAITFTPGTLTINPAPLTINIANLSKVFGDLNPTLTAATTGLVLDQTLANHGTFALATSATQFTDVGDHAITATFTGTQADNYTTTINPGTLSISKRPVSAQVGNITREYGEANPTITVGLVGTNPVGTNNYFASNVTRPAASTTATTTSNVGTYAATVAIDAAANPNFDITVVPGSVTVTAAPLSVKVADAVRTYGASNPTFGGTTTGLKLSDTLADVVSGSSFTSTATITSNVGQYAIIGTGTTINDNYDITFSPGTLTIDKAALFIAPALSSRLYGDADPTFTISATGLLNGDTASVVRSLNFSGTTSSWAAGSYSNRLLSGTASNYALTFGTGTINILPRPLTITANTSTREYGDTNPALSVSFDNLASFDTAADIPDVVVTTSATAASSVVDGGYGINVTSGANRNYTISYETGRLMVTPANLRFGTGSFFRTYGQADTAIEATLIDGLKLADTADMLGATVDAPAPTVDVGTYPINVSLTNPNYMVADAAGQIQILPAQIGVSVGNVARRYGDANPAQTEVPLTVSGLAFGQTALDVLSPDFGVDATADVGNYPIGVDLFSPNYQIADLSFGNLAVLTRQIALMPANVVRYYGDENPAYDILIAGDGLASFDTIDDVAFSDLLLVNSILTDGLPSSLTDAGLRQIRVQPTGNPNYAINSVPGLFVVLPRPITLTTADASATENRTPPTFSTTATNLVSGQSLQSVFPDLTHLVFGQDAPAAVSAPLTPTTYPIPDAYTAAVFRSTYLAEPAASRPAGEGQVSEIVPVDIEFPEFEKPTVIRSNISLSPLDLLSLNGSISPALLGEQSADDPQPVTNYVQPMGYTSNPNYVVTAVNNGTLTIEPDPIIVAQKKAAAEAEALANELPDARAAFFNPPDNNTAFGLVGPALTSMVNAVYGQVATQRFDGGGNSALQEQIVGLLGLEPGSSYSEAQLYRLMAEIPHDLEVRALFAPVLDAHIRSLVGEESLNGADAALVAAVNDRLAAQQATFAASARQAAQAEMRAYEAEQKATGAGQNLATLFGRDVPYDQIVKDALGSVVEEAMTARLAELIDQSGVSTEANLALTGGTAAVAGTTAAFAAGSTVAALIPFGAGRTLEIASTVGQVVGLTTGAGAGAATIVATSVVAVVVMSVQRSIQLGDNEGQRLIYEGLVDGTTEPPTLSDINLDQTKGNGAKKLDAALNENLLSLAIFDIITG